MKYLQSVWCLLLTPIYYSAIAIASLCILLGFGSKDFNDFWYKNK